MKQIKLTSNVMHAARERKAGTVLGIPGDITPEQAAHLVASDLAVDAATLDTTTTSTGGPNVYVEPGGQGNTPPPPPVKPADPVALKAAIMGTMAAIIKSTDGTGINKDHLPGVKAIEEAIGYDITAAERNDAAMALTDSITAAWLLEFVPGVQTMAGLDYCLALAMEKVSGAVDMETVRGAIDARTAELVPPGAVA